MDAHTLNAWTRFALQKGGIGSATALVDNPATDIEDLMFMAGESITVLRRLADDAASSGGGAATASASSAPEDNVWYLGYCEGVVGRFRASHVQIHGKLKKPVLMRRSGVGAIRDSTLRPMSKSEAAAMPASQVPPGIPVNAIDVEEEDDDRTAHAAAISAALDDGRGASATAETGSNDELSNVSRRGSDAVAMYQSLATPLASTSYDDGLADMAPRGGDRASSGADPFSSHATSQPHNAAERSLGSDMGRLSITTPPLSDETHLRALRQRQNSRDSDSDDSETHLPWARDSVSSAKSTGSRFNERIRPDETAQSDDPYSATPTKGNQGLHPLHTKGLASAMFPPSPISSAESQLLSRTSGAVRSQPPSAAAGNQGYSQAHRPAMPQHASHKGRSESTDTTTTESSTDGPLRNPNTFSIYDIYGRDSVAMPNFEFRQLNGGKTNSLGARLAPGRGTDSVSSSSRSTPSSPQVPQQFLASGAAQATAKMQGVGSGVQGQSPPVLRVTSQRRPMAAPPVAPVSAMPQPRPALDTGAREYSEASMRGHGATAQADGAPQRSAMISNPDPYRPPPNLSAMRKASNAGQAVTASNSMQPPRGEELRNAGSSESLQHQQAPSTGFGSNLLARRMREGSLSAVAGEATDGLRITVPETEHGVQTNGPPRPFAQMPGALPSPSGSAHIPLRSSSERLSDRERLGAVPFRKNSNILPGANNGAVPGLTPPVSGLGSANSSFDTSARSASPLLAASASSGPGRSPRSLTDQSPQGNLFSGAAPPAHLAQHVGQDSPRPSLTIQTPMQMAASYMPRGSTQSTSPRGMQPPGSAGLPHGSGRPQTPNTPSMRMPDISQLKFDELGFVRGSCPPIPLPRDDVDDIERWRQIVNENDVPAAKKARKVRKMVEKGIPHSSRPTVWPFLLQSTLRRRAGLFEELCKASQSVKGRKGKEDLYALIEKDIDRAYPDHKMFLGERRSGQADLEAVLKAYAHYNPRIGYVQGLNLVAGFFLILAPAEDAFWMLCALLRDTHIEGYYADDMKQVHVDGIVFGNLLHTMDPDLTARLQELEIEPFNFAPAWIMPMFVRILPWATLLRVWDMFFYEGPPWVLRVALAIIRVLRDPLMDRRVCPGHGEALRLLLHPPQQILTPENVIPCALSVKIKDGDVRKLSRQASKVVRQTGLGNGPLSPALSPGPVSATASFGPHDGPDRSRSLGSSSHGHEVRSPSAQSSQRAHHQIV